MQSLDDGNVSHYTLYYQGDQSSRSREKNLSNLMTQISNCLKCSLGHDGSVLGKELYTSNDMTVIRNGLF